MRDGDDAVSPKNLSGEPTAYGPIAVLPADRIAQAENCGASCSAYVQPLP
jgi:hypothetical protein